MGNLTGALRNALRQHSEDADDRQYEREPGEDRRGVSTARYRTSAATPTTSEPSRKPPCPMLTTTTFGWP
jgi:hypothetical protein